MTRDRLRRYRWNAREIRQLGAQLDQLRAEMLSPRTSQLTGIPPAGTGGDSEVERAVIRYADLEALYSRKRAALLEEQEAIELAIEPLPSPERQILRAHYIEGLTWEQVCVTVGYSWRQTHRHHARAIRQLEAAERENMA